MKSLLFPFLSDTVGNFGLGFAYCEAPRVHALGTNPAARSANAKGKIYVTSKKFLRILCCALVGAASSVSVAAFDAAPALAYAQAKIGDFAAQTLNGGVITREIFAEADLTMLNVWGTFCPPCIREMPELGRLARELAPHGVRIVGLVCDWTDSGGNRSERQIEKARAIVSETGADYTHALLDGSLAVYLGNIYAVPQSFFVDKNGTIVAEATGARSGGDWEKLIFKILPQVQE